MAKEISNPNELVWVDTGEGPVRAMYGTENMSRPISMHQPKQMKRSEVAFGWKVLDEQKLKLYTRCIAEVDARKASKDKAKPPLEI
jgi:hypothetical protein